MGMLEETFETLCREAGSIALSIIKVLGCAGIGWVGLRLAGIDPGSARFGVPMALFFFGSAMFFLGRYQTGKHFWAGYHGSLTWVDKETPVGVWKIAGGLCWAIGVGCALLMG